MKTVYSAIWLTVIVVVFGPVFVAASCHRDPPAAATSADDALCAHLASLGCKTGVDHSCPIALARLRTLGPIPDTCAAMAGSAEGVRACGFECEP